MSVELTTGAGLAGKRAFDIVVAVCSIVLLSPALLVVAVAVKIDSPGPVFFRQSRIGWRGKPFRILKFRTMQDIQEGVVPDITVAGDARVTDVGRLLRRLKFDEIPQLFNVLYGDMSLVGPRPEVSRYVREYPADARDLILSVRPGITDSAAIEFRDEELLLAQSDDPERYYIERILPRKLELYSAYIRSWSFGRDLKLIFDTVLAIMRSNRS